MFEREKELYEEWLNKDQHTTEELEFSDLLLSRNMDADRAFYAGYHSRDEEIKQIHKDYGYEIRDPNGTIWDHCQKLQERNDRIELVLKDISKFLKRLPDEWFPESLNNTIEEISGEE